MNWKNTRKRGTASVFALAVIMGVMLCRGTAITARAEKENDFFIQAEQLPWNTETYDIKLTVENQGPDWEGTVRVIVEENYKASSAYDTVLSLPQGSKKQFEVKVPLNSIDTIDGTITVTLLDDQGGEVMSQEFSHLLGSLAMGILSDSYSELTFLDMGGKYLELSDDYYPISLTELHPGSLQEELDGLTFLVIDRYDTGMLTEEEKKAILNWNLEGGLLILGTGAYAEDTLRGFENSYLGISYRGIDTPEEVFGYDVLDDASVDVDWSQLTLARLHDDTYSRIYQSSYPYEGLGAWLRPWGAGSVCVLCYSLTELGSADEFYAFTTQERFVNRILYSANGYAGVRDHGSPPAQTDNSIHIRRMLEGVGNSNSVLNFGALKVIVILYVIFAGPVLYLILSRTKRRELYWIAVPVTALLGVGLIFFVGRGFEVVDTKAYSVTVKNLSGGEKSTTYLYCYDAERSEWDLRLAEGCEYVGSLGVDYSSGEKPYYYHIKKEGDIFSLGIDPSSNFEDSYFYLSSTGNDSGAEGSLVTEGLRVVSRKGVRGSLAGERLTGTVVNDTNKDMAYFAVLHYDKIYVYEGLLAGASCDLENVESLYEIEYENSWDSEIYDTLQNIFRNGEYRKASALSALGVGIYDVDPYKNEFVIIGVVEDWDKAVDDRCNEISYGCLYSVR